ncbi:hypothetical protein CLIB1444_01S10132 [[Candida] jaroonii]|uniref:Uncharacterized protein n=1 Tax=[Candida] jaroonii TaxID=467808 RepID=A0ACA9Y0W5_9ASCO|nr:hypothetical protein CLIB1444_01S10132 [[Candida] jaroonii]
MNWFRSKANSNSETTPLTQKSHQPLNLANTKDLDPNNLNPQETDINHTLNQIVDKNNLVIGELKSTSTNEMNESVTKFVSRKPTNLFVIDGEKDVDTSIICTEDGNGGKTCLKLQYNSIQLFKQMQKLEYFCSLPDDINATYFECRKIQ